VGAVLTLIVFAIMLTTGFGDPTMRQANRQRLLAAVVAGALWTVFVKAILILPWRDRPELLPRVPVAALGHDLLIPYLIPFELISVIFMACLVGAIAIAAPRLPPRRESP